MHLHPNANLAGFSGNPAQARPCAKSSDALRDAAIQTKGLEANAAE